MSALMVERKRTLESELSAQVSKDVVSQLEHDAASVRRELGEVKAESETLHVPFEQLATVENAVANEWLEFEEEWGEGLPVATNEAAEIRGEVTALKKSLTSLEQERERRQRRLTQLHEQHALLTARQQN